MNALVATLIAALFSATAVFLSQDELNAIFAQGTAKTEQIARLNRSGTLAAATVKWQLDKGTDATPTPAQLVADGYLDNLYLYEN